MNETTTLSSAKELLETPVVEAIVCQPQTNAKSEQSTNGTESTSTTTEQPVKPKKERILWLDVAKFFGILFIFMLPFHSTATYGSNTGKGSDAGCRPFMFAFLVQMFFALAGFSEHLSSTKSFKDCLIRNVKGLLLPFFCFSFVSLSINCIVTKSGETFWADVLCILQGNVRNAFVADALWFLSCLFVMRIVFYWMRKLLRYRVAIFALCLGLFLLADNVFDPHPLVKPSWHYNVDSAAYYFIFYAIGYCTFDWIRALLKLDTWQKRLFSSVALVPALIFTIYLFFNQNLFAQIDLNFFNFLFTIITPLIVTYCILMLSRLLQELTLLQKLGQHSMYLCGTEYIVKACTLALLNSFKLGVEFKNPLGVYVYSFVLLLIAYYLFIPVEKYVFKKLFKG